MTTLRDEGFYWVVLLGAIVGFAVGAWCALG